MGGAKGVVDVNVRIRGQFLRKNRIVFLLLLMKADVLQQHNPAGLDFGAQTVGVWADHILSQRNRELEQLGKALDRKSVV